MSNPWENPNPYGNPNLNQNKNRPPVPPQTYGSRMWRIWSAFVIKLLVGMGVSVAAVSAYSFFYVSEHYEEAVRAMQSQENMLEMSMGISEQVLKYTTIMEGVSALIVIPILMWMFHKDRKRERIYGVIPNKKAPLYKYPAIIGIAAAMCIGLNNLILIGNLGAMSEGYQNTSEALYSASFGIQILCLGILVPIAEELVFRGLMFKRMREQAGFMRSAVYISLVFGIFHGNMVQMIYAFILGMLLAWVHEKYGSVKAPILAHIIMNLVSVIATQLNFFGWMAADAMRISLITIGCAALAATMFVVIQRIEEKPDQPDPDGQGNLAAV